MKAKNTVKILLAIFAIVIAIILVESKLDDKYTYIYAGILLAIVVVFMSIDRTDDAGP